jgi:hypothetical protein
MSQFLKTFVYFGSGFEPSQHLTRYIVVKKIEFFSLCSILRYLKILPDSEILLNHFKQIKKFFFYTTDSGTLFNQVLNTIDAHIEGTRGVPVLKQH